VADENQPAQTGRIERRPDISGVFGNAAAAGAARSTVSREIERKSRSRGESFDLPVPDASVPTGAVDETDL
jgi:hypothetical protein